MLYPFYSQEGADDPIVIAKLFDPVGSATWWITEYDPVEKIAFCQVTGPVQDEFGCTSLIGMESNQRPFGLTIEQDLYFVQNKLSECLSK